MSEQNVDTNIVLSDETRAKIASAFAGDSAAFAEIDKYFVTTQAEINRLYGEKESLEGALTVSKKREVDLLEQVSDLYSKVPGAGGFKKPQSAKDTLQEVLSKDWFQK